MTTTEHKQHIASRIAYNNCQECRADNQRRFVDTAAWRYSHVADYLAYVRPRIAAIRSGEDSTDARIWLRKFRKALHTRISLKVPNSGRKWCDSYLERMGQFPHATDAGYLRRFALRGASTLEG